MSVSLKETQALKHFPFLNENKTSRMFQATEAQDLLPLRRHKAADATHDELALLVHGRRPSLGAWKHEGRAKNTHMKNNN